MLKGKSVMVSRLFPFFHDNNMRPIEMDSGERLAYSLNIRNPRSNDLVLIVHGTFCCRNDSIYVDLSENLQFNSLRMDLIGSGNSEGEFSVGNYTGEVECIHRCVVWCRENGFEVVGLIGHSKGGNEVLMYAGIYSDVPAIVSLASRFDTSKTTPVFENILEEVKSNGSHLLEWNGKKHLVTWKGLQEKYELDMNEYCSKALGNFLIVHGGKDKVIPTEDSTFIFNTLKVASKRLEIFPQADHMFTGHIPEISALINDFLLAYFIYTDMLESL